MEQKVVNFQELLRRDKSLNAISDRDLQNAFLDHMLKARHTEGNWIEFRFAELAFQEMQVRGSRSALRWSWFWGFASAVIGSVIVEVVKKCLF